MPCVNQTCRQGREPCATPYTCQYEDSGYLPREQAALEAEDTPPVTAEGVQLTFGELLLAIGVGLLAACGFAAYLFY